MMTDDDAKNVSEVYRGLAEGEEDVFVWDKLDTQLEYLEMLTDEEIVTEAISLLMVQSLGTIGCSEVGCKQNCFAIRIVEAVKAILNLFAECDNLHIKNRYVLAQYLGLSHIGNIVSNLK